MLKLHGHQEIILEQSKRVFSLQASLGLVVPANLCTPQDRPTIDDMPGPVTTKALLG